MRWGDIGYVIGAVISLPFLPFLYWQGKRIRAKVPELPEAEGPEGIVKEVGEPLQVVVIGESTMAGVGVATHAEGFAGSFGAAMAEATKQEVRWKVYAKGGYTAARVVEKLVPEIIEAEIDWIVVGLGGNDAFKFNSPWRWRAAMHHLIQALRQRFPNTPIVFANMPPIRDFPAFPPLIQWLIGNQVELLGRELKTVVQHYPNVYYNAEVITFKGWIKRYELEGEIDVFFSDGVHPSQLTYEIWAKDLVNYCGTEI